MPEICAFGDQALLINFDQKIDKDINLQVISLNQTIVQQNIPGIIYTLPAYCSLTVAFDPFIADFESLKRKLQPLLDQQTEARPVLQGRKLSIPVCYEDGYALDFEEVCRQCEKSREEIIQIHTSSSFHVFMLGFLPGFTYMGKVPESLFCLRHKEPRLRVPERSVGLAGYQTGIYPMEAPGGWQIIGKTPLKIFDPQREDAFLMHPGDEVRFRKITVEEYQEISDQVKKKAFEYQEILG